MPVMPGAGAVVTVCPFAWRRIGCGCAQVRVPRHEGDDEWCSRTVDHTPTAKNRVLMAGEPLESATGAIIAVHGRGASA